MHADALFINNHVDIIISYHDSEEFQVIIEALTSFSQTLLCLLLRPHSPKGSRIVGVEVLPRSIKHKSIAELDCGSSAGPQEFKLTSDSPTLDVIYTYSVSFKPSRKWPAHNSNAMSSLHSVLL